MYGLKKRPKDESGLIQGAGTGTSDDVKKNVPAGSYIMPADSTAQIGAKNLKNLGKPPTTEVNVSNGEYLAAPEQLQAIGGLVLDQMKNSTHTPVDKPQLGFKSKQASQNQQPVKSANLGLNSAALAQYQDNIKMGKSGKPELFFANGTPPTGVPDLLKRRDQNQNPLMSQGVKDTLSSGFGKTPPSGSIQAPQAEKYTPPSFTESVVDDIGNNVGSEWKQGNYARGLGQGARGILSLPGAAAYDALKPVGNFIGGLFNTDTSTPTSPATPAKQPEPAQKAVDVIASNTAQTTDKKPATTAPATNTDVKPSVNTATQAQSKPDMFDLNAGQTQTTTTQPQTNPYEIQQKGNAFSYANPNAAAQARANGVPELQSTGVQKGVGIQGIKDFMANTREMGASEQQVQNALAQRELGMQGYAGRPRLSDIRTPEQEAQLQTEISRVSAPIAGSRGLTTSQRNQINDLQMGYSNRANDVYKTDANNAAGLQREAMGQSAQNYRAELGEQGTNNRFNANLGFDAQKFQATNDLANREFNLNATEKGFGIRNSSRLEKLYEQYDSAKSDEDRKSIQEKINRYTGGKADAGKDRYMTVGGGQEYNKEEGVMINRPQQLFDTQTQQFVDTPQGNPPQRAVGTISKVGGKTAVWDGENWVQQ